MIHIRVVGQHINGQRFILVTRRSIGAGYWSIIGARYR